MHRYTHIEGATTSNILSAEMSIVFPIPLLDLIQATLVLVHIPKCGSTFCLSMSRAQCPWAFAPPLLPDPSHDNNATASSSVNGIVPSNNSTVSSSPSFCSAFDEVLLLCFIAHCHFADT